MYGLMEQNNSRCTKKNPPRFSQRKKSDNKRALLGGSLNMADDWKWTNQVRPGTCALCRHIVGGARTISAKSDWLLLLEATFPQSASLFHKQTLIEIKHSFITAHVQKQVSVNQHFIFIVFSLYTDWIVCKSHNVKAVLTLKMVLRFEHCWVGRNRLNQWFSFHAALSQSDGIQPQTENVLFVTVLPVALANTQCILLYSGRKSVFKMNLLSY